ncbi:MAG: DUF4160 domain-containing protein [Thiohalospira sp.]
MPTIMRRGPYRLFFYSNEPGEPPHVHIQRDQALAKFWLSPVALAGSTRFGPRELRVLNRMVAEHREGLMETWHEYFRS